MVDFWDEMLKYAIKKTEHRIKIMERNGLGNNTMAEKAILVKQKRTQQLRKENA